MLACLVLFLLLVGFAAGMDEAESKQKKHKTNIQTRTDYVLRPEARNYRRFSKIGKVSKDFIKKFQKNHQF